MTNTTTANIQYLLQYAKANKETTQKKLAEGNLGLQDFITTIPVDVQIEIIGTFLEMPSLNVDMFPDDSRTLTFGLKVLEKGGRELIRWWKYNLPGVVETPPEEIKDLICTFLQSIVGLGIGPVTPEIIAGLDTQLQFSIAMNFFYASHYRMLNCSEQVKKECQDGINTLLLAISLVWPGKDRNFAVIADATSLKKDESIPRERLVTEIPIQHLEFFRNSNSEMNKGDH